MTILRVILKNFLIYMTILLSDLLIYLIIKFVLQEPIQKYPLVSFWFDQFIIGVSFLVMLGFVVHSIRSIVLLISSEWASPKGGANEKEKE